MRAFAYRHLRMRFTKRSDPEKAAMIEIATRMKAAVAGMSCVQHKLPAVPTVTGTPDHVLVTVSACCEPFRRVVEKRLAENFGLRK